MEKLITKDTIRRFAYSNVHLLKEPARGIVVSFFGLGYNRMQDADTEEGIFFAVDFLGRVTKRLLARDPLSLPL